MCKEESQEGCVDTVAQKHADTQKQEKAREKGEEMVTAAGGEERERERASLSGALKRVNLLYNDSQWEAAFRP